MKRGRKLELVLFIDPRFWEHPKGRALSPVERDEWFRLLGELLCSGNGGSVPSHAYGVSRRRIQKYIEVGLLDDVEGTLEVHNWDKWNGREAYKRFLARGRKRRQRRQQDE